MVSSAKKAIELSSEFNFVHARLFQEILDNLISGDKTDALDDFVRRLDRMGKIGEQYKKMLKTPNPEEFNYYLYNALVDILFFETDAVTV